MGDWTFFSNHGHVLVCLAQDSEARLRDVALMVGITERAVQKIVRDLQDGGYLEISKHGRRNRYRINNRKALRHQLQSGCTVGQLLNLVSKAEPAKPKAEPVKPKAEPAQVSTPSPEEKKEVASPKPVKQEPKAEPAETLARRDLEQGRLF